MNETKFDINMFRPGDGLLIRNDGGFFGNRIQNRQSKVKNNDGTFKFTPEQARFTHVEVLIVRSDIEPSKFWSVRIAPPRAKLVDFIKHYKGRYVKIVRYNKYDNLQKLKNVALWAATHVNVPYDWPGILKFVIVWVKQHSSMWFCSENYVWAHQKVYSKSFDGLLPHKSMPAHGLLPEYVDIIWEGYLSE